MFPPCYNFSLDFNNHKSYYMSLEDYLDEYREQKDITPEERKKCIETDTLWEIQLYPLTPISFIYVASSTFEGALIEIWKCYLEDKGLKLEK